MGRDWGTGCMERGLGVHSPGGASVSSAGFSLLYPHLNCTSEKDSADWLRVGEEEAGAVRGTWSRVLYIRPQANEQRSPSQEILLYVVKLGKNCWAGRTKSLLVHHWELGIAMLGGEPREDQRPHRGSVGAPPSSPQTVPCCLPGLMMEEPRTFALAAPAEDMKFPSSLVRLARKA